jgi:hypothetical protein
MKSHPKSRKNVSWIKQMTSLFFVIGMKQYEWLYLVFIYSIYWYLIYYIYTSLAILGLTLDAVPVILKNTEGVFYSSPKR